MLKTSVLLLALLAGSPLLQAQLTLPPTLPAVGARMPALSPNGRQIAFVYRGDIWTASSKGGRSVPLTRHMEQDAAPLYSPDGQWIAFASKRNGNWDMFVVPAEGGTAQQLTWHSGAEVPHGWSPDGKWLLFSGKRDSGSYGIYAVDINTLRTDLVCQDFAELNTPNYSPDGKSIVYGRHGFPWSRPRYAGSAAEQIWIYDLQNRSRRPLTSNHWQHLWTRFLPDGQRVLTVSVGETTPSSSALDSAPSQVVDSPLRTPNLWVLGLDGSRKPLTSFTGGSVRFPTVAAQSGDIAFEYETDLWLLRSGKRKAEKIVLYAVGDEKQTLRRREKLSKGVTEAEPSPDGKTFAFGLRGEIWSVVIDRPKGAEGRNAELAKRLTEWAGDDSDFSWSPDGKKLYFTSDREYTTRLYELDVAKVDATSLWNRDDDITGLRVSPDGKQLGFWVSGREGGLYVLPLGKGEPRRVVKAPGPQWRGFGGGDFSWSPDMKWIAFAHRGPSRAWNIFLVPTDGGEPVNVTQLYADHSQPIWSPDGKYLYFQSNRDGSGLYVLPLTPEAARASEVEMKFEKSTNVVVTIDFNNLPRRIRKLSSQSPSAALTVTPDGRILFISESDVWTVSYDGKETKRLTTGGGKSAFRLMKDGRKATFIQNGELYTMSLDGSPEKVSFTADWERDVRMERRAAFTQFWNAYHRGFYDGNFHGRDWVSIRRRYEPFLEAGETHEEFADVLQMMVGELEASHTEVTAAVEGPTSPVTPHLGFTFDYTHHGPGIRVADVPKGAPGSYRNTRIKPGEYLLQINGEDVSLNERLYEYINDKQERTFEFLVGMDPEKKTARLVKYRPLKQSEWDDLGYRNRIERLRDYVDRQSSNRIGYLHLAAMQPSNEKKFEREAYEYMAGKEAMIIDVRFNRGGNIADTLIDWIEREPHGFLRSRDGPRESAPHQAWDKKIIVLINEHSYSNSEIFPYAMRARGLARLVGMPTPGYVIWTDPLQLVDGTGARIPQTGFFRLDGSTQENNGEAPDVLVPLSPADWLAKRDPQLDKAIQLLLAKPVWRGTSGE